MTRPDRYTPEQRREYNRKRYARLVEEAKELLGGKCVQCSTTEDLEFDHIDPATKSFNATCMWGKKTQKVEAELAKYQLLCKQCHLVKTLASRKEALSEYCKNCDQPKEWTGVTRKVLRCRSCDAAKKRLRRKQKVVGETGITSGSNPEIQGSNP